MINDWFVIILIGVILIDIGYWYKKKRNDEKDKKSKPKPNNQFKVKGIKLRFDGDESLRPRFIKMMRRIKTKDPALYKQIVNKVNTYRILPGYYVDPKTKKQNPKTIGMAYKSSGRIDTYAAAINDQFRTTYKNHQDDFYLDHWFHEVRHLFGDKHGIIMNHRKTKWINRIGGKIDRSTI